MEAKSVWYDKISGEIILLKERLSKKDYKKYKLDMLVRVAKRVDDFSLTCGECQITRQEITNLVQNLGNLIQLPSKEGRKSYNKAINDITKHLQKVHKLVTSGYYMGICMGIGTGLGAALGAALDNPGIGTPLGIGLGLVIGSYLDRKAKKEDRVI